MDALMKEYTYRYDKHHATERLTHSLWELPTNISHGDFTDPPQCMPNYCKGSDTVKSYQTYYIVEKGNFATWKKRVKPEWWDDRKEYQDYWGAIGTET